MPQLELPSMNKLKEITDIAIMRLREFEPKEGYYLAFSGGKDSTVLYDLAVKSGVKFDARFSFTTVDPPEVQNFIRENYPDVEWHYPDKTMWQLIYEKGMPTRKFRFCCEHLKETGGAGRFVLTGIRWAESSRRKERQGIEICNKPHGKSFLHPIIDWMASDVWDYLTSQGLPHCSLYDEGYKRIGCVLCPMSNPKQVQKEIKRFPKLARAWRLSCERYWKRGTPGAKRWSSAEGMWQWWLSRKGESKNKAQYTMFD